MRVETKSGIRMNVRLKIFLLLSLVLLGAIMLYVWVYSRMDHQRLMDEFKTSASQVEVVFKAEQKSAEMNMLQIATFVAHDQKVQQLFLLGKKAVELEGGGAGGELAGQVRQSLFEHVQASQKVLAERFGFRQLQFHFGPGSLSFLRIHRPEKFGDRMDKVRYTIVAANAEQKSTMGFETGRIFSGIRGVTPVYAIDSITQEKIHIGALEAGTSFSNLLALFHQTRPWFNTSVLLSREHLQANVWPEFLDGLTADNQFIKNFYVEGTTSSAIKKYLARDDFTEVLQSPGQHLLPVGKACYNFISFPLRDFRGETNPDIPAAGVIVVWEDVSAQVAAYHNRVYFLIFCGLLLFFTIEVLMYFALTLMTKQLQKELLETQKQEEEAERARLVAEESSRLKTQFLGNMSHELRTPMNAIMGLGQLLGETPLGQQQQSYIDKINISSKSLLTLIDEILLISDMDSQTKGPLSAESFNPKQLLERMKDNFTLKAKNNSVVLTVDYANQLPKIKVDGFPDQIEWALNQLIGNAIKFSRDSNVILSLSMLEQTEETTTLEFSVTDHGIGIAAEQQEQIFQPFYQGDGSRSRNYSGTGLGLTIAQKVCQQLGGELKLVSTLGQGSCFSFSLTFENATDFADDLPVLSAGSPAAEPPSALPPGTITELVKILYQLEAPLSKLQAAPCQDLAISLKDTQWPEKLSESIEKLTSLIEQYRFVEAQKILLQLKERLI